MCWQTAKYAFQIGAKIIIDVLTEGKMREI